MNLIYQFAFLTVFVAIAWGSCGRSSAALPEKHVRPWDNGFIGFGALLVFLVVPYCLIPFGMDFTDTPWHIRNFPRYKEYPMTALSYFLADRFTALMGNEVITTRALTVFLMQVTILLPFLTLVPWRAHRVATSVLLAVLGLLLSVKSSPVLGWDSFSGLFLMGASVCLLSYVRTGRCVTLVLFGFFSGLATCSRLPNVVIIFVGVLLITGARVLRQGCDRSNLARRLAWDNGLFLLAAIATVLIVAYLLYGSVQEYFSSAFSMISISNTRGTRPEGHDPRICLVTVESAPRVRGDHVVCRVPAGRLWRGAAPALPSSRAFGVFHSAVRLRADDGRCLSFHADRPADWLCAVLAQPWRV